MKHSRRSFRNKKNSKYKRKSRRVLLGGSSYGHIKPIKVQPKGTSSSTVDTPRKLPPIEKNAMTDAEMKRLRALRTYSNSLNLLPNTLEKKHLQASGLAGTKIIHPRTTSSSEGSVEPNNQSTTIGNGNTGSVISAEVLPPPPDVIPLHIQKQVNNMYNELNNEYNLSLIHI